MIEWQNAYNELKRRYLVQSRERLQQIENLIAQMDDKSDSLATIKQIRHHFHWLAGSGGIYGMPELTSLGKEAEQYCENCIESETVTTATTGQNLQKFVESARNAFVEGEQLVPGKTKVSRDQDTESRDILVVDQDPVRRAKFHDLFKEHAARIEFALNYSEAVTLMASKTFDGLIVSIPLEGGSGYELVEKFRTLTDSDAHAALIVGQQAGFLDKVQAIHCGADGFFEEPFVLEDLAERMRFLLEVPKAPDYRVLYVEDDPYQSEFVRVVLSAAGYDIEICSNEKTFDAVLTSHQPDLVILDIMLPDVSGYELAKYLRQNEAYATLPIIFVTTEAKIDAKIRAAKAGGDEYLVKPVPPSLLLSTVAAKLERARFLKSLLHRDGLTKLLTHSAFMSMAKMVLSRKMRQPEKSVGLIIIDIDRFKSINDKYGHPVGDRVIVSLANLLRRRMRKSDLVGRYGGEEFVIIVEDLREPEVIALAERLLADFGEIEYLAQDEKFHSSFSAGVAMLDSANMELGDWVNAADGALLHAKQSGRNRVVKGPIAASVKQ